jgi:hypothetical protein
MARWIVRDIEDKEYLGTLVSTRNMLFSDIDEYCNPYSVEFALELPYRSLYGPIWFKFDDQAPYTGVSGIIIECK